jgi:hypothetical protein
VNVTAASITAYPRTAIRRAPQTRTAETRIDYRN